MQSVPAVQGDSTIQEPQETNPAFGLAMPRFIPRRYKPRNVGEWTGHLGFASDLIVAIQPELIVELGTHWGEAYFTFCQTVQEHGLGSLCYAVDHWLGDEHAGWYGEEVFDDVKQYNDRYYKQFSYLLRTSFDDAVLQFGDGSIGLLHIDGLHTYDAVSHDFRMWLPKVKPGGIVMLHDVCPKHQDFGVWRLWDEIKAEFPGTFEFHHSWGLGVLRKEGEAKTSPLTEFLFNGSSSVREEVRRHYVIYASHLEHLLGHLVRTAAHERPLQGSSEIRVKVFPFGPAGHSEATALIHKAVAGEWSTLTFELPDGNENGAIRVDPEHQPCLVEVGDILIHSTSGELLWSDMASASARNFTVAGNVVVFPIGNGSLMTSLGNDPQLLLPVPNLQGRLRLTISLRVSLAPNPAPEIVHSLVKELRANAEELRANAEQQVSVAKLERDTVSNQLAKTTTDLGQVTAEQNETQQALNRTQDLLAAAEERLRQVQDSLSWKVTSPIRKFMSALRSGPRKTT